MSTRPPGDATRVTTTPTPVSPTAPTSTTAPVGATPPATGATPPPPRTPALDAAAALRVFVEEVRAAAETRLVQGARPAALPPLPDADPGNAAAALLRWLRAAAARSETPVPAAALREVVETAYARAADTLQRAALAAPPSARTAAPSQQDVLASAREALASARELVVRGMVGDARAATRMPAMEAPATERATPTERAPATAQDAPRVEPVATTRGGAVRDAMPSGTAAREGTPMPGAPSTGARVAMPPLASGGAVATPATSPPAAAATTTVAPTAVRVPPVDPIATLRTFVEEVRVRLQANVGAARMPAASPPIVADPRGASLAPALLRWLTTAVAEKGVALPPLQDAVRTAFARVDAGLAAVAGGESSPALAQVRETLVQVRDQVLRGLGASPEREERVAVRVDTPSPRAETTTAVVAAPRGEARAEIVADPRGVPVPTGAPVVRDARPKDRVEPVDVERRRGTGRELEAVEPSPRESTDDRRDGADLQGPMDCVRRYFDAYLAGDSAAYAAQWVYPACVWSDGQWSAYPDAQACAAGNDAYTARLRLRGVVGGRIVMLRVEPTSVDAAVVHGVFTRERADGTVISEVEAAYTTVNTEEGWRVAVCIVKPAAADGG